MTNIYSDPVQTSDDYITLGTGDTVTPDRAHYAPAGESYDVSGLTAGQWVAISALGAGASVTGAAGGPHVLPADGSVVQFRHNGTQVEQVPSAAATVHPVPDPPAPADLTKVGWYPQINATGDAYELAAAPPAVPPVTWTPDTVFTGLERFSEVDPADPPNRRLYEVPAGGLTSGSTPPGFDAAESVRYTDLGPADPGDMVGATDVADGAKGTPPQPVAGDQDKVLHGDATWRDASGYKGEVADTPALIIAATASPTIGSWWWVDNGGVKKRGAFKQLLDVPVNGSAFSGWYGDKTFPETWDSTDLDWSSTEGSWDMTGA